MVIVNPLQKQQDRLDQCLVNTLSGEDVILLAYVTGNLEAPMHLPDNKIFYYALWFSGIKALYGQLSF